MSSRRPPDGGATVRASRASVGPVHVITLLLVVAAITSGMLALSVSDAADTQSAGGATPSDAIVASPLFDAAGTTAAEGPDLSNDSAGGALDSALRAGNDTDRDGDLLADTDERRWETDPDDPDTDGDGIPDGLEVHDDTRYPDADPLQQDLYVEVDATGEHRISAGAIARIETTFADAPVDNPGGSRGIDAHVLVDDRGLTGNETVYSRNRTGARNDVYDFRASEFDARGSGYYYVLLTGDVAYNGQVRYVGAGRPGVVAMEAFQSPSLTASLFMHELGHAFGIDAAAEGVDQETYSIEQYDSVMNYNGLYNQLTYSDGSDALGRDEWAYVANDRFQPPLAINATG